MQLYSCLFASTSQGEKGSSHGDIVDPFASPRCSFPSSSSRTHYGSILPNSELNNLRLTMSATKIVEPRLVRQESFKRSRSFQAEDVTTPTSAQLNSEFFDSSTVTPVDSTHDLPIDWKAPNEQYKTRGISSIGDGDKSEPAFSGRGLKRSIEERTLDLICSTENLFMKTPQELQDGVASRIEACLTHISRGAVEPKPIFVGSKPPSIPLSLFVQRMIAFMNKYADEKDGPNSIGVSCAALAVELIERAQMNLDQLSLHRSFLVAYMLAAKSVYDFYFSNSYWSEVGGISIRELNAMEIVFCEHLRWDLRVSCEKHHLRLQALLHPNL